MKKDNFVRKHILPLVHQKAFTLVCFLLVLVILFSVWSGIVGKKFFSTSTFINIFQSIVVTGFLCLGSACLLISGNVDLSTSTIGCFGGMVVAVCAKNGMPWYICILACFALCAVFGFVNGILVSKLRFPAFIATLGMTSVVKGLTYLFSAMGNDGVAANINYNVPVLGWLGRGKILTIPVGVYFLILFFVIYGILITKTRFGMKLKLIGGNPLAANLAGLNSSRTMIVMFINAAVLSGVAGIFNGARLGQGSLSALATNQFTGMTAAILGGISFGGGIGGMGGAFLGLLILNTFQVGMNVVGINPFWVSVFSGVLLLVALAVDFLQMQGKGKTNKRASKEGK
ncbi:MAG: ABC transporter permease [Oscillospiraceae bacterium]|nr:ABC transporter permease [Oscillospiraceae bacterium]